MLVLYWANNLSADDVCNNVAAGTNSNQFWSSSSISRLKAILNDAEKTFWMFPGAKRGVFMEYDYPKAGPKFDKNILLMAI